MDKINNDTVLFIENNIDLIDDGHIDELLLLAAKQLYDGAYTQLIKVLDSIGIYTEDIRKKHFAQAFMDYVEYQKQDRFGDDAAHSWSRLQYALEGISNFGFDYDVRYDYVLQHTNELGLKLTPLSPEYSWEGSEGDYDLGWFNKKEYEKEYLQDDEF